jgi:hypothetical protein
MGARLKVYLAVETVDAAGVVGAVVVAGAVVVGGLEVAGAGAEVVGGAAVAAAGGADVVGAGAVVVVGAGVWLQETMLMINARATRRLRMTGILFIINLLNLYCDFRLTAYLMIKITLADEIHRFRN